MLLVQVFLVHLVNTAKLYVALGPIEPGPVVPILPGPLLLDQGI